MKIKKSKTKNRENLYRKLILQGFTNMVFTLNHVQMSHFLPFGTAVEAPKCTLLRPLREGVNKKIDFLVNMAPKL